MADLRHRTDDRGFTLVELLVVLAILALLAAFVAPQVIGYLSKAKADVAKLQLENIIGMLDMYFLDTGAYPTTEEGLAALVTRPASATGWNGPYARTLTKLHDPWGDLFQYRQPGEHGPYDLFTLGADRREGGEGDSRDIANWADAP